MTSTFTRFSIPLAALAVAIAGVCGCSWNQLTAPIDGSESDYREIAGRIQYDDVTAEPDPKGDVRYSPPPQTLDLTKPRTHLNMSLEQVIEIGLRNSKVLRDLGGTVLRDPALASTILDPAIQESDPRNGVEAALSVYDVQLSSTAFFENNDRALNNTFFGGGTRTLQQDLNTYQTQLSKRSATGTEFILRNNTVYDANNAPGNRFASAWDTNLEAEVRQPLLQGAGTFFNRTVGPGGSPGLFNGVIIARVARDITLSDFQIALRQYLANIENAYWDLYFAYRDLDAKKTARDESLRTWNTIRGNYGRKGFEADKEAQAREQFYRFQQEVQDALSGRVQDGTRSNNGSTGGTFRRTSGVLVAERRLRLLMGWPINSDALIRPLTEPIRAPVQYQWDAVLTEALSRRPELLRQRKRIKRRQLELDASQSFLKPRLDAVGRYRARGFGKDLLDSNGDTAAFGNAAENLTDGNFQEWQFGLEFSIPLGFRQAHAAVHNAELRLARERTVLREQERQVVHDLSNAVAEVKRAYVVVQTAYNRLRAAKTRVDALKAADSDRATPDQLLESHSRLADAESRYFLTLVEYMVAVRNVHLEKGSLFDYRGVSVANDGGLSGIEYRSQPTLQFEAPVEVESPPMKTPPIKVPPKVDRQTKPMPGPMLKQPMAPKVEAVRSFSETETSDAKPFPVK